MKREFAWFVLAVLLVSSNMVAYSYLLALLPIILLLEKASVVQRLFLVGCYALITIPLKPSFSGLFPKLWLMLALFLYAGRGFWRLIPPRWALAVVCAASVFSGVLAERHLVSYHDEPAQMFEPVVLQPGSIYASSPAIVREGIVFQAVSGDRFGLRFSHDGRIEEFRFDGHALNPAALSPSGPIRFELLADGKSTNALFDLQTKQLRTAPFSQSELAGLATLKEEQVMSPDGKWIAFTKLVRNNQQVWVKPVGENVGVQITGGACDSWSPAWDLDSGGIVFASDCSRGMGCPRLYRARLRDGQPIRAR
jgi:hypothetical protein